MTGKKYARDNVHVREIESFSAELKVRSCKAYGANEASPFLLSLSSPVCCVYRCLRRSDGIDEKEKGRNQEQEGPKKQNRGGDENEISPIV